MQSVFSYGSTRIKIWATVHLKKAGLKLLPVLVGFALARTGILGRSGMMNDIFPFGASLAAAAPSGTAAAAMTGVLLGFLLPGSEAETLRCAASALAVAGIKWALSELKPVRNSPLFRPSAAFFGVVLTGMVVTSSIGAAISYDLAAYIAEGAMAAAGAYFFCGAMESWERRMDRTLSDHDIYNLAVTMCIFSIPLCRIQIFGISPFSAILMLFVLAAAFRIGASGGAAAGIAVGLVMALADGRFAVLGVISIAGLAAAIFRPLGKIAVSAAFSIGCSIGVVASGATDLYLLMEAVAASVIFPTIKEEKTDFIFDILEPAHPMRYSSRSDGYISRRLSDAARGLEEASQMVIQVSEKLDKINSPKAGIVCRRATEEICANCAITRFCWETSRDQTGRLFDTVTDILRADGRLDRSNIPEQLRSRCARWGEMVERINSLYAEFAANEGARRHMVQARQAVAGQLCGCGQLLVDLAEESRREESGGEKLTQRAADILSDFDIYAEDVCCTRRRDGSLSVTMTLHQSDDFPEPEYDAAEILSEELETKFTRPMTVRHGESLLVTMESRPNYSVTVGSAQHSRGRNRLCGDAFEIMNNESGSTLVILADGMGSGCRAAVDAAMACDLTRRLLSAGFGEHGVMELVNSAMQISSDEEALVTLDCARIDLYSGKLTMNKAGAANSYVLRKDSVHKVEIGSLPLGIMQCIDSGTESIELDPGDVVLMVSDGALSHGDEWIVEELETAPTNDMQRLAKDICSLAAVRCAADEDDDITVIVFRLDELTMLEEDSAA